MPATRRHTHKYHKVNMGHKKPYIVYACALPHCRHYVVQNAAIGKMTICWKCGNEFILNRNSDGTVNAKPICPECKQGTQKKVVLTQERPDGENPLGFDMKEFLGLK